MALICPKCSTQNNAEAKFCKGCGYDLRSQAQAYNSPATEATRKCGKCGAENSLSAKFCKSCGASFLAVARAIAPAATFLAESLAKPAVPVTPAPAPVPAPAAFDMTLDLTSSAFDLTAGQPAVVVSSPVPVPVPIPQPVIAPMVMPPSVPVQAPAPAPTTTPTPTSTSNTKSLAATAPSQPFTSAAPGAVARPVGIWLAVAAAGLTLAGAGYWWMSRAKAPAKGMQDVVLAQPAPVQPSLAATSATSEPTTAAKPAVAAPSVLITETAAEAGMAAGKPVAIKPATTSTDVVPAVVAPPTVAQPNASALKSAEPKVAEPKVAPPKAVDKPTAKSIQKQAPNVNATVLPPAPAPAAPREAAVMVPIEPAPAPTGPTSPKEACGSRIFLALSNCMTNQCQTAQFSKHPQCVQLRQQEKDRLERSSNTSNDR